MILAVIPNNLLVGFNISAKFLVVLVLNCNLDFIRFVSKRAFKKIVFLNSLMNSSYFELLIDFL